MKTVFADSQEIETTDRAADMIDARLTRAEQSLRDLRKRRKGRKAP